MNKEKSIVKIEENLLKVNRYIFNKFILNVNNKKIIYKKRLGGVLPNE